MKLNSILIALIGLTSDSNALPVSDELQALSNFDHWAETSIAEHNVYGKAPSIGVAHGELPFVVYRLLKKSNVWASGHLLNLAQRRFDLQSFDMESETLMLMSDLMVDLEIKTIKPSRVQRVLRRLTGLADKGDELAELIQAWGWASRSIATGTSRPHTNLDSQKTESDVQRLRGIRADLLTLLANVPDEHFESVDAVTDVGAGSGDFSGDGDILTINMELINENNAMGDDIALLVNNGIITDDNGADSALIDLKNRRGFGLFEKVDEDDMLVAEENDTPMFEKFISNSRNSQREPRLIRGQNTNENNNWLGYSLLGSIGAIFITVSATVCVRRMKSDKVQNSGTPIQKLKRYQVEQKTQQKTHPRNLNQVNFSGYNAAYRPQFFNPNQPMSGGFSSAMSHISSGASSFGPSASQTGRVPQTGPTRTISHHNSPPSMSSGYVTNNDARSYPNQNRALPPPPYSKVQY